MAEKYLSEEVAVTSLVAEFNEDRDGVPWHRPDVFLFLRPSGKVGKISAFEFHHFPPVFVANV